MANMKDMRHKGRMYNENVDGEDGGGARWEMGTKTIKYIQVSVSDSVLRPLGLTVLLVPSDLTGLGIVPLGRGPRTLARLTRDPNAAGKPTH